MNTSKKTDNIKHEFLIEERIHREDNYSKTQMQVGEMPSITAEKGIILTELAIIKEVTIIKSSQIDQLIEAINFTRIEKY
jgi:hypothetical protein